MNISSDLGRWSWGGGGFQSNYSNVKQAISLAAGSAEANQLVPCGNDVIVKMVMM